MQAYHPSVLRVNLSTRESTREDVPEDIARLYVGGRGFGIRYLHDEIKPGIDALGEENKILFLVGPLAGTGALSLSRWMVVTKSPLTGTYCRSVGGADFGAWMAFAGLECIVLEGRAEKPVYLYVEGETCKIMDATPLWGMDTSATQEWLAEMHGNDVRAVCIGPAGENLVRYASILSGRRCAGRGGTGAVMGSKNLKAVVLKGFRRKPASDEASFKQLVREQAGTYKSGFLYKEFCQMGTTTGVEMVNAMGFFPTRNFRWGELPNFQSISAQEYLKITEKHVGCNACPVNCGKVRRVPDGPFAGAVSEGPDYQSIWALAGSVGYPDVGFTVASDALCDDLGLDTISSGVAIGFAYELFEKGLLTAADTQGLDLKYGDPQPAMGLLRKIAQREGIGDILADGVMRAAARIGKGSEDLAMHVKGLEMPGYDPRGAKALGLNYATANRGADHTFGYAVQEIFGIPVPRAVDRLADEGKGDIAKFNQDLQATIELAIACNFPVQMNWLPLEHLAKLMRAATGIDEFGDAGYLLAAGERVYNLERLFNLREGFGRKDDTLPQRMQSEPIQKCSIEGEMVRKLDTLLDEYYEARGWSREGVPTAEKLQQLGLAG